MKKILLVFTPIVSILLLLTGITLVMSILDITCRLLDFGNFLLYLLFTLSIIAGILILAGAGGVVLLSSEAFKAIKEENQLSHEQSLKQEQERRLENLRQTEIQKQYQKAQFDLIKDLMEKSEKLSKVEKNIVTEKNEGGELISKKTTTVTTPNAEFIQLWSGLVKKMLDSDLKKREE